MAFKHFEQIKSQELPSMEIGNVPAFLKDFAVSEDSEKPITCGLFRLEAGESLQYTYTSVSYTHLTLPTIYSV